MAEFQLDPISIPYQIKTIPVKNIFVMANFKQSNVFCIEDLQYIAYR